MNRTRILAAVLPVERLVFESDVVCAGHFDCAADDALFPGGRPSTATCLAFSRTPVWIHHDGGEKYVADPTVVTFHNRNRPYRRWRISDAGDRCDWLAFPADVLADVLGPDALDEPPESGPFPFESARVSPHLYLRQRRLFDALDAGRYTDSLRAEEAALGILAEVVRRARGETWRREEHGAERRFRDEIAHVRAMLAHDPGAPRSLGTLGASVGLSPFQLCRAFARVTGETLSVHRNALRLLASLERVSAGDDLTTLALDLGFSSHSHFTAAFRTAFGTVPSRFRGTCRVRL